MNSGSWDNIPSTGWEKKDGAKSPNSNNNDKGATEEKKPTKTRVSDTISIIPFDP